MDITLKAVAFQGGVPVQTELNLTQRPDGSWHAKNFDDILKDTRDASKSGAAQSPNRDTFEREQPCRPSCPTRRSPPWPTSTTPKI